MLHPAVTDRQGHPTNELAERSFEVYEDGVRQQVRLFRHDDVPATVGLIVDHSGSMKPKMTDVIAAARAFVYSSRVDDEMFVINFNEDVSAGLPEAIPFTSHSADLEAAIGNAPVTGKTALYDAIGRGMAQLRTGTREKKALVVISDGGDNASRRTLPDILKLAAESSAIIYTVGIFDSEDPDRNTGVLRNLARATGGEAFFPSETADVVPICQGIARDIRNQYTIGYVSANTSRSDAYRKIRVVAHGADNSKLVVRTRSGYIAGVR